MKAARSPPLEGEVEWPSSPLKMPPQPPLRHRDVPANVVNIGDPITPSWVKSDLDRELIARLKVLGDGIVGEVMDKAPYLALNMGGEEAERLDIYEEVLKSITRAAYTGQVKTEGTMEVESVDGEGNAFTITVNKRADQHFLAREQVPESWVHRRWYNGKGHGRIVIPPRKRFTMVGCPARVTPEEMRGNQTFRDVGSFKGVVWVGETPLGNPAAWEQARQRARAAESKMMKTRKRKGQSLVSFWQYRGSYVHRRPPSVAWFCRNPTGMSNFFNDYEPWPQGHRLVEDDVENNMRIANSLKLDAFQKTAVPFDYVKGEGGAMKRVLVPDLVEEFAAIDRVLQRVLVDDIPWSYPLDEDAPPVNRSAPLQVIEASEPRSSVKPEILSTTEDDGVPSPDSSEASSVAEEQGEEVGIEPEPFVRTAGPAANEDRMPDDGMEGELIDPDVYPRATLEIDMRNPAQAIRTLDEVIRQTRSTLDEMVEMRMLAESMLRIQLEREYPRQYPPDWYVHADGSARSDLNTHALGFDRESYALTRKVTAFRRRHEAKAINEASRRGLARLNHVERTGIGVSPFLKQRIKQRLEFHRELESHGILNVKAGMLRLRQVEHARSQVSPALIRATVLRNIEANKAARVQTRKGMLNHRIRLFMMGFDLAYAPLLSKKSSDEHRSMKARVIKAARQLAARFRIRSKRVSWSDVRKHYGVRQRSGYLDMLEAVKLRGVVIRDLPRVEMDVNTTLSQKRYPESFKAPSRGSTTREPSVNEKVINLLSEEELARRVEELEDSLVVTHPTHLQLHALRKEMRGNPLVSKAVLGLSPVEQVQASKKILPYLEGVEIINAGRPPRRKRSKVYMPPHVKVM